MTANIAKPVSTIGDILYIRIVSGDRIERWTIIMDCHNPMCFSIALSKNLRDIAIKKKLFQSK